MTAGRVPVAWEATTDVVVVGTGVAGLTAALDLTAAGRSVLLLTKGAPEEAGTQWAQGGVAVVTDERDPGDSIGAHIEDTLVAGGGLSDPAAVAMVIEQGPAAIRRLRARGATFDAGPDGLLRTREGGHSARRVIHAGGDATGAEIERALLAAGGLPTVLADHVVLDVLRRADGRACGVSVLGPDGTVGAVRAGSVVLATGGAGHLYAVTTNPSVATGDGLAVALRAGAALADVEFFQFHPTVLWSGGADRGHRPLVTEAVRGEGAVLIDGAGARVMTGVHPMEDLAPRDVVSLAVTRRLAQAPGGIDDHVFLDATRIPAATFRRRFPTVYAACLASGVDPTAQPIPVAPAAHYHCGGVLTDLDGRTTVPGLFAVGEVARTGLHGANRLASNSLLEGLVLGERAAAAIGRDPAGSPTPDENDGTVPAPTLVDPADRGLRQLVMSARAGIGRDADGLGLATATVLGDPTGDGTVPAGLAATRETVEAANLRMASAALLAAAAAREESRGCHVRTDFPERSDAWSTSVLVELGGAGLVTRARAVRQQEVPA
ncbi:L-aspartate oxidase [Nakamurella sp. YIM 132087]|uniref:L-aspartate oxidase n=1 Tax=Nakamurella alba TaxID=2665158 RepID=A0A7K1FUY8_9ACTN|nr:L-aspartate oxidase [Nakamurella alba]MTD16644.1 L-aspartate oxidase [Nakamurella alba]